METLGFIEKRRRPIIALSVNLKRRRFLTISPVPIDYVEIFDSPTRSEVIFDFPTLAAGIFYYFHELSIHFLASDVPSTGPFDRLREHRELRRPTETGK